jgi:hypothetical protein
MTNRGPATCATASRRPTLSPNSCYAADWPSLRPAAPDTRVARLDGIPLQLRRQNHRQGQRGHGELQRIKALLDGGVGLANLAPGIAGSAGTWYGGAINTPTSGLDVLTGGQQEFELPVKSLVHFDLVSCLGASILNTGTETSGQVQLLVDGGVIGVAEFAAGRSFNGDLVVLRGSVSDSITTTLAAGKHTVRALGYKGGGGNFSTAYTRVSYIAIPTL